MPSTLGNVLADAAREACLYLTPLVQVGMLRANSAESGRPVNSFFHKTAPTTPTTETVTAPNNDTLSSSAFIDLSAGPLRISLPPTGARYFSLQLMDAWTSTFCVLGTRTTGPGGGEYVLAGPDHPAPPRAIRAPSNVVWALGRTLADGAADLAAAHAVQQRILLRPSGPGRTPQSGPGPYAPWAAFFSRAQALLLETPPPATDDAVLRRVAVLGLRPEGGFDATAFDAAAARAIAAGVAQARQDMQDLNVGSRVIGGWVYQSPATGAYGQDYLLRAATCHWGIGALIPQEALYLRATGDDPSHTLPGGRNFRLHFPAGNRPPVDAFWSMTLYRVTDQNKLFLFENPLRRYSLGDRSQLSENTDGSLDIWIAPADPGLRRRANWLPAPPAGRLALVMRLYLPRPDLLEGRYILPPVESV